MTDADGNVLLDLANAPTLGYNSKAITQFTNSAEFAKWLCHKPALGIQPNSDWTKQLQQFISYCQPAQCPEVITVSGGPAGAIENAMKLCFIFKQRLLKGNAKYTPQEIESALWNQKPGVSELSFCSFSGNCFGKTAGLSAISDIKPEERGNIPTLPGFWPKIKYPTLKYPLEQYKRENKEACVATLKHVNEILQNNKQIAGVIFQPIQDKTGIILDESFGQYLQQICEHHKISLLIDETHIKTGITGRMWAHQHYTGLIPHIVAFGNQSSLPVAGVFSRREYRPSEGYMIYNTWMGDTLRMVQTNITMSVVNSKRLVENANVTGQYLTEKLEQLQRDTQKFKNLRSLGLWHAWEFDTPEQAGSVFKKLLQNEGVFVHYEFGSNLMQLKPSLKFTNSHADILLTAFRNALS